MLTDAQWVALEPLIEACRPKGKTPPRDLRRTMSYGLRAMDSAQDSWVAE